MTSKPQTAAPVTRCLQATLPLLFAAVSLAAGEAGDGRGIDAYLALESAWHSNAALTSSARDDWYMVYYGGISYPWETSTRELRVGAKARYSDYFTLDALDNFEVQGVASLHLDLANGGLDMDVKAASLKEAAGQDLLIWDRLRRGQYSSSAGWEADFEKTDLALNAGIAAVNYAGAAYSYLDYTDADVALRLGRRWNRSALAFSYRHRWADYTDAARTDFTGDYYGLYFRYDAGEHLALETNLGLAQVTPDAAGSANEFGAVLRTTYSTWERRTLLMLALRRDVLPASIGAYSVGFDLDAAVRRRFSESVKGEVAFTYETGDYSGGLSVTRACVSAGLSIQLGSRAETYLSVSRTMNSEEGGATIPADYTLFALGLTYGL